MTVCNRSTQLVHDPAEESAGGLLYRQGNVYSFIDRIDDFSATEVAPNTPARFALSLERRASFRCDQIGNR